MRLIFSRQFLDDYARLAEHIQEQTDAALARLQDDPTYPGLRMKKMRGLKGVWEARVTRSYRVVFEMSGDVCLMLRVGPHDIEKRF